MHMNVIQVLKLEILIYQIQTYKNFISDKFKLGLIVLQEINKYLTILI